jgi:hypothetical protein
MVSSPESTAVKPSEGGWTMNWRGMVMRCGEHDEHTTRPHFLQLISTAAYSDADEGRLPAVVLSKQKCKLPAAHGAPRDFSIGLPRGQDKIALTPRLGRQRWQRRHIAGERGARRVVDVYGVSARVAGGGAVHADARGAAHGRLGRGQAPLAL